MTAARQSICTAVAVPWLAVLWLGCGGAASGPGPQPPPPPDEGAAPVDACPQELGRDAPTELDGAPALDTGTLAGCFGQGEDQADAFQLSAPEHDGPILYRYRLETDPGATGCFEFLDASRAATVVRGVSLCAASPGAAVDAWLAVMGGTTAYVRVKDLSGDRDRHDRPYTLTVQAEPVADLGEPNQTPDTATALTLGEPADAFFATPLNGPDVEMDVYRVEVPRKGKLAITVENVDPGIHLAARISNPAGARLVEKAAPSPGATLQLEQNVARPGPFFIELRNIAGAGTPAAGVGEPPAYLTQPYRITVSQR